MESDGIEEKVQCLERIIKESDINENIIMCFGRFFIDVPHDYGIHVLKTELSRYNQ